MVGLARSTTLLGLTVPEFPLRLADRLVDDLQSLQQRVVVHHDRRAHSQDVAGGNPGQALAEGLLVDQLARFVEGRLRPPGP